MIRKNTFCYTFLMYITACRSNGIEKIFKFASFLVLLYIDDVINNKTQISDIKEIIYCVIWARIKVICSKLSKV